MKRMFIVLTAVVVSSCSSISPVGVWNYSITGTPEGDFSGIMTVSKKDKKAFDAILKTNDGELKFDKFEFVAKTKKSTGDFNYQGTVIFFDADVKADEMAGNLSTQGMNFPFKATRKNENNC